MTRHCPWSNAEKLTNLAIESTQVNGTSKKVNEIYMIRSEY